MSNPQTEDGYTRIANELLDAIVQFDFGKRQYAVVLAVIRKTYGYNRKSDALSITQISEMTNLPRPHVSSAITELVSMNVFTKSNENGRLVRGQFVAEIGINKNYKSWVSVTKTVTTNKQERRYQNSLSVTESVTEKVLPKRYKGVTKTVQKVLPKQDTHKDNTKRQPKRQVENLPVPDFGGDDLLSAWNDFIQHRIEIKKPMTALAATKAIAMLAGKQNPVAIIERSIINGWQGLFDDQEKKNQQTDSGSTIGGLSRRNMIGFEELQS